jgi:short-subunit dehydrogenase
VALPAPSFGTTVVVTGATSGIGEAITRQLARRGHGLALVARTEADLERLADELDVETTVHPADLTKDRDRTRLVRDLRAGGRDVVGLVNSAGTGAFGPVLEHSVAVEDAVFRTNALGVFDLTNRIVRDLVDRGEGAILNLASILAFAPFPQNATYAATKAFVQSFSEALHTELAGTGVSCTTVNPGPTRTPIFARSGAPGVTGVGGGIIWQDAEDVARDAVEAMVEGRRTVTPGLTNKLAVLGLSLTPRTALLPLTRAAQSGPMKRLFEARDDASSA